MRITRLLAGPIAVALLAALLAVLPGTLLTSAEAAKPPRLIYVRATEPRPQKFYLKGDIAPQYAKKRIVLERKANAGATWKPFKTFTSNKKSRFKVRIFRTRGAKKTCWRVIVPKSGGYRYTKSSSKCLVAAR